MRNGIWASPGQHRDQCTLFAPSLEDMIASDHPVRRLEDATATKVVRDRAQRQGRLPEVERELQSFYEKTEMNSPRETFNDCRRLLSRLGGE